MGTCASGGQLNNRHTNPSMIRRGSYGVMAKNFLKNLDAGLLIDRTQPGKRKSKLKRKGAPASLLKFSRSRPTATDNAEGKPKG